MRDPACTLVNAAGLPGAPMLLRVQDGHRTPHGRPGRYAAVA